MSGYYEQAKALGATDSTIAGIDLLTDDGMPFEMAAKLMVGSQQAGRDPETDARMVLQRRRWWREIDAERAATCEHDLRVHIAAKDPATTKVPVKVSCKKCSAAWPVYS